MKRKTKIVYVPWCEKQIEHVVEMIIEHGLNNWEVIRIQHNAKFGHKRSEKSIVGCYQRLRDSFVFFSYKKAWKMMEDHPSLFKHQRKERKASLKDQVNELQKDRSALADMVKTQQSQINELMEMLKEQTDPR